MALNKATGCNVLVAIMAVAGCGGGSSGGIANPPPGPGNATFSVERVFPALSFNEPVGLVKAPNDPDTWYVVERRGTIRRFNDDPNVATTEVFASLTSIVDAGPQEAGLLGMAFDPAFATNGFVFLSYTTTGSPLDSRIVRYSAPGGGPLDTGTGVEVLRVAQNQSNHNGGQISFGPDGLLYGAFGDGGGGGDPGNNGQDTGNLRGTIIRISLQPDGSYLIPGDNPFAGNALCRTADSLAGCPEIFAWGLRNPWRFSFDRTSGTLLAGDVGQGSLEEIDRIQVGGNYGWAVREGNECFGQATCPTAGLIDPIHVYGRTDGRSVTGGFVYRGAAMPALAGRYVFGDFVTGRIWSIDPTVQAPGPSELVSESSLSIASFGEDETGELFVVDFGGGLYQINQN